VQLSDYVNQLVPLDYPLDYPNQIVQLDHCISAVPYLAMRPQPSNSLPPFSGELWSAGPCKFKDRCCQYNPSLRATPTIQTVTPGCLRTAATTHSLAECLPHCTSLARYLSQQMRGAAYNLAASCAVTQNTWLHTLVFVIVLDT
jgi:hypothetical protein